MPMRPDDRNRLRQLFTEERTLALGVLVDGTPYVGLLPFAMTADWSAALVHASRLARHSRGMGEGAPFSVLVHQSDTGDGDPLQVLRIMLQGTMSVLERGTPAHAAARRLHTERFPTSEPTFSLGDFALYRLAVAALVRRR